MPLGSASVEDAGTSRTVSGEERVVEAALRCIARWGLAKTTLDDIAREAQCSRATVYRLFPGGKHSLIEVVGEHEVGRLLERVSAAMSASTTVEQLVTDSLLAAASFLHDNEALGMIVRHEPEMLLPFVAFDRLDPILAETAALLAPLLERFCEPEASRDVVEWCVRLLMSYGFAPSPTVSLTDRDDVTRLVQTYVMPGIGTAVRPPDPLHTN